VWTKPVAVVALLSALFVGCSAQADDLSAGSFPDRGKAVVMHLVSGDFAGVRTTFNSNMVRALSEPRLRDGWRRILELYGSFRSMGAPTVVERAMFTVVRIPLTMARGNAEARITFDQTGAIAGLYILRPGTPL
jgi:hypothetical protein